MFRLTFKRAIITYFTKTGVNDDTVLTFVYLYHNGTSHFKMVPSIDFLLFVDNYLRLPTDMFVQSRGSNFRAVFARYCVCPLSSCPQTLLALLVVAVYLVEFK
jgi:hypothetical protein